MTPDATPDSAPDTDRHRPERRCPPSFPYCRSRTLSCSRHLFCRSRSAGRTRSPPSTPPWPAKRKRSLLVAQRNGEDDPRSPTGCSRSARGPSFKKTQPRRRSARTARAGHGARPILEHSIQSSRYLRARVEPLPLPEDAGPEVDALHRAVVELASRAIETRPAAGRAQFPADARRHARPAAVGLPARLDAQPGRGQGAGAARSATTRHEALRLLHGYLDARSAGAGTAPEDRHAGADGDDQGAARIHAAPADAGHSGRTGREKSREGRGRSPAATIAEADLPDEVRKEADRELDRLERLPPAAPTIR